MLLALVQQSFLARESREFARISITASHSAAGDGHVNGLVEVCALFASNKGLRF